MTPKTLGNTTSSGTRTNVPDFKSWGDADGFKLICKGSSDAEGWMKSTKAMEIHGAGCLVQVTTHQRNPDGSNSVAEALTFVPAAYIYEIKDDDGNIVARELHAHIAVKLP